MLRKMRKWWWLWGGSALLLSWAAWALIRLDRQITAETYGEIAFVPALAQEAVKEVLDKRIKADQFGIADLPPALVATAKEGLITITRGNNGLVLIFFPTRHERFGARGYLYCSRPLAQADTTLTQDPLPYQGKGITIKSPSGRYTFGSPGVKDGTEIVVPLTKQVDTHWWRIADYDREI